MSSASPEIRRGAWNRLASGAKPGRAKPKTRFASQTAKRVREDLPDDPGYGATAIEFNLAWACLDRLVNNKETV
jgi:hypothetical protein